jgi:hypothetical protein
MSTLRKLASKYLVRALDQESGEVQNLGFVTLPRKAMYHQVEEAASRVGLYAPRGLDELRWDKTGKRAVITDSSGTAIGFLDEVMSWEKLPVRGPRQSVEVEAHTSRPSMPPGTQRG